MLPQVIIILSSIKMKYTFVNRVKLFPDYNYSTAYVEHLMEFHETVNNKKEKHVRNRNYI